MLRASGRGASLFASGRKEKTSHTADEWLFNFALIINSRGKFAFGIFVRIEIRLSCDDKAFLFIFPAFAPLLSNKQAGYGILF